MFATVAGEIKYDQVTLSEIPGVKKKIEYPDPEPNYGTPHSGCNVCQHLLTIGKQDSEEGWTCRAFPAGIPWELCMVAGGVSHCRALSRRPGVSLQSNDFRVQGAPVQMEVRPDRGRARRVGGCEDRKAGAAHDRVG